MGKSERIPTVNDVIVTTDQYETWGNGIPSIAVDSKNFEVYYALWIYLKDPLVLDAPYWLYWSTRDDCDCSKGYCDKNATSDVNKFDPQAIVGAIATAKLDYYGDSGCQYKQYGKKFYFSQNAIYYMCIQKNKLEMGTIVKSNTTEKVWITIDAVAPPKVALLGSQIQAPSSLAKISGIATFTLALIAAFLM